MESYQQMLNAASSQPSQSDALLKQVEALKNQIKSASSRDHQATMEDNTMLMVMAKSWPAWEQFFAQCQRDMAKYPKSEADERNLNMIQFTLSQIINRALDCVDQGNAHVASQVS